MRAYHLKNKIELLAPAGSYEAFQGVIHAGADAVYLGGNQFGARAYAENFDEEKLLRAIDFAHIHGRQVYLTVNTLFKEEELEGRLYEYLLPYYKQGLDAVILADMGAFGLIREAFPQLAIHTSTQMTITSRYGAEYMKQLGAARIVTAREMSFEEIRDIRDHVDVEIESFVHGALCYSYSGQCLFSSMLGGRSGNRGRCAQPCRLPYEVYDSQYKPIKKREGKKLNSDYILSPKDLCTVASIPRLIESGITSFKIEGRMKQAEYAAGVVSVYRRNLDSCLEAAEKGSTAESTYQVLEKDLQKLYHFGNRSGFTNGYYTRHNGREMITFDKPGHTKSNEVLQREIRETYIRKELKEKINGNLRLYKDLPAIMELSYGDTVISVTGDIPRQAQNQPLTQEKIEKNMQKTGNTPFEFGHLQIELEADIFLPVQSLNQIRREALDALEAELVKACRREEPEDRRAQERFLKKASEVQQTRMDDTRNLSVSIGERGMLPTVLGYGCIDDIYLDSSCYTGDLLQCLTEDIHAVKRAGKNVYYVLPSVFRSKTASFYLTKTKVFSGLGLDGLVVKSFDEAAFIKNTLGDHLRIITDHHVYTYSNRAINMLDAFGICRNTVPFELNRKELRGRENQNSELVIYGYLPLMTSAQCVHANMGKCDKEPVITYLKDRYGKYFPVKNHCMECYNTIYNSVPLILFEFREEFENMGIKAYRISFTKETASEIQTIMELYEKIFLTGKRQIKELYMGDYTNGHFKRGVE